MRDFDPRHNGEEEEEIPQMVVPRGNWSKIMPQINLPSLESLILDYVPGLSVNDAFSIGRAAPNLPC